MDWLISEAMEFPDGAVSTLTEDVVGRPGVERRFDRPLRVAGIVE